MSQSFYLRKSGQYTDEQKKCIETAMEILEGIHQEPLMLLGRVQSGKTALFLGVTRLCFDKGYDIAIVFTKVNIGLTVQTTCRMKEEFEDERVTVLDIMQVDAQSRFTGFECKQKMIVVVKKQKDNFQRLKRFIEENELYNKKILIVDDEADYASTGFQKTNDDIDFRKISNEFNMLRGRLKKWSYIQVTATPYSLFLQPEVFDIGKRVYSIRPAKTILVPCGENYIGGQFFFNTNKNPLAKYFYIEIEEKELEVFEKDVSENVLKLKTMGGITNAIINFITSGVIRTLQNGGDIYSRANRYSMVVHTENKKDAHKKQILNIDKIIQALQETIKTEYSYFEELVKISMDQLRKSIMAYGFNYPSEKAIIIEVEKAIFEYVKIKEVNSDKQIRNLLNAKGELELVTPLNIFVGGQVLDRGITIPNLISFYYGRRPKTPQQDTMIQHLRIFGYRDRKDLAVTRIYTTLDIYTNLQIANEADEELRKNIEKINQESHKFKESFEVILVNRDERKTIKLTSTNKIFLSKLIPVGPNSRHLPIVKDSKKITQKINLEIEEILKDIDLDYDKKRDGIIISLDKSLQILELCYKALVLNKQDKMDKETMESILTQLSKKRKVILMATKGKNLSRITIKGTEAHAPDHPKRAKELAIELPVLILIQQTGSKELGWTGDAPFWWPVLISPKEAKSTVYARTYMK